MPLGTTNTQTIALKNQGKTDVTISNVNVNAAGFKVSGLKFPLTLLPAATTTFEVEYTPTKVAASSGTITVEANSGHVTAAIDVSGTGVADTRSLLVPTSLNFGNVTLGAPETMELTIKNTGNSSVKIAGVTVTGTGYSATGISSGLTIGASKARP